MRSSGVDIVHWLFEAQIHIGTQTLLLREVLGNVFGLLSALGGMRRKVWAWPVGIVGNALLFTVFLGAVFGTPDPVNLLGQAGRQVMFVVVSVYGWYRWTRRNGADATTITPHWASGRTRAILIVALIGGTAILTPSSPRSAPTPRSGATRGSSWGRCSPPTAWRRAGSSSG